MQRSIHSNLLIYCGAYAVWTTNQRKTFKTMIMRKKLLLLAGLLLSMTAGAQLPVGTISVEQHPGGQKALSKKSSRQKAPARVELAANQRLIGGYITDDLASSADGIGLPRFPGKIFLGSLWDKDMLKLVHGTQMTAIRVGLANAVKVNYVQVYGVSAGGNVTMVTQDTVATDTTESGWTSVQLTTPLTIDTAAYEGYIVGYEYNQLGDVKAVASYPCSMVEAGRQPYPEIYAYANLGEGLGFYSLGNSGNLSVQAIVEGTFPENVMHLNSLSVPTYHKDGKDLTAQFIALNEGSNSKPSSYTVDLMLDGELVKTLERSGLVYGQSDTVTVALPMSAGKLPGEHKLQAVIKAVNGSEDNAADKKEATRMFINWTDSVQRQAHLIEQYTSNTCTYCYLGDKVLESTATKLPSAAWVAYHMTMNQPADPANIAACDTIAALFGVSRFPGGVFNRSVMNTNVFTPDNGPVGYGLGWPEEYTDMVAGLYAGYVVETAQSNPSFVTLNVLPELNPDNEAELKVTVNGVGVNDVQSVTPNHGLTVLLCEDSVKFNQYSNGKWVSNENHNNVLRAVLGSVRGNAVTWNGNNFTASYTYTIPKTMDQSKLKLVVFFGPLVNGKTEMGSMVTNQACEVQVPVPTAIKSSMTDAKPNTVVAVYNAAGQRVEGTAKGVNIVRYADGTTKKILVP